MSDSVEYDKLVRDRIPESIRANDEKATERGGFEGRILLERVET